MIYRAFLLVLLLGLGACQTAVSERSFSAEVLQGLSANGMAYIHQARQSGDLQRIMDEIADGNGLLIDNAYLMRRSLQQDEKQQLKDALAQALGKRPAKILALMPAQYAYEELCVVPDTINAEHRQRYLGEVLGTLKSMDAKYRQRQQQQCLMRLQAMQLAER